MTTKAANYINQLDQARCNGDWKAVPELVRKIRKHAPDRVCLTLTAETEYNVALATEQAPGAATQGRPDSQPKPSNSLDVSGQVPKLQTARDAEAHFPEEKFQAQVCTGWMQWAVGEYTAAAGSLPKTFDQQTTGVDPTQTASEWTAVCILRGAYLKGNCLVREDRGKEALITLHSALPALARLWAGLAVRQQFHYLAELFLTEYCTLAARSIRLNETSLEDTNSLACFRCWAKYWGATKAPVTGGYGFKDAPPRRRVWREYYQALTRIVEEDTPFPAGYTGTANNDDSPRALLQAELRSVEASYRTLLLAETSFPRADETRDEVEDFVRGVLSNWTILCGRGWREADLGAGGRNSYSRNVLDSLYSAAAKTYHSTSILRSLFIVHLSVAEFDLAFKAFDSYLDLVKKGKARVEKTGHVEKSLDDDGVVLETMAKCIIALCRFGHKDGAEKARHLGADLEDWLSRLPQSKPSDANATPAIPENGADKQRLAHPPVASHVVALAWQAIGLSHGHWSRVTPDASSRTEIQAKAIRCLKKSLAPESGRSKDVRSLFALALLLAEQRELTQAIEYVKRALKAAKGNEEGHHLTYGQYWQERSLIPMWHLLSLLMSARQDYTTAARACDGALEQFRDPVVLYGKISPAFQSEHLNEADAETSSSGAVGGLVDDMDDAEKEGILEVKMTQLSLLEVMEGSDVAVNSSHELLTLYARLFGVVSAAPQTVKPQHDAQRPPRTSGTLRSIKGSIFAGRDRSRPPTRQPSAGTPQPERSSLVARPPRPSTAQPGAPAIHVTGEGGRSSSVSAARSESRRRGSLKTRERSHSRRRASSAGPGGFAPPSTVEEKETPYFTPAAELDQFDFFNTGAGAQRSNSRSSSYTVRNKQLQQLNSFQSTASKSSEYSDYIPTGTMIASSVDLLPLISFSKDKEKMQRAIVLVRVWLFIAHLYRRAEMHDEGSKAVSEAKKLVAALESENVREMASAGRKGAQWAEKKTIEDLWGDVYAELGQLHAAKDEPYQARDHFETALTHAPDHAAAIIGLSGILLDVYAEELLPPPTVAPLANGEAQPAAAPTASRCSRSSALPSTPLGLGPSHATNPRAAPLGDLGEPLLAPYKTTSLPLTDRLAARDRAYALLSGLTRTEAGWNSAEAWFTLARAYEESGQAEKAKDVLWWCVELEEAKGVRDWQCLVGGGYTL